jgi:hypothetical protein
MIFALIILIHSWYPTDCCGEGDCQPVPCEEIHALPNGTYEYKGIRFDSATPSPDERCHACIHNSMEGVCLFINEGHPA